MDLTQILKDWPFNATNLSARRFVGEDGKTKVQMRIDLGIMHMEYNDRPDGERPHGHSSVLNYFESRESTEEEFVLTSDAVFELRQEAIQYYHRYLSLYQLKDYRAVIRDTRHNLDIIKFIAKHATEAESIMVQQHRPHVMMMNTTAKVMQKLEDGENEDAMSILRVGIQRIKKVYRTVLDIDQPELAPEIYQLKELQHRITDDGVPSEIAPLEKLEVELQMALLSENYERAAALRDQIEKLSESSD